MVAWLRHCFVFVRHCDVLLDADILFSTLGNGFFILVVAVGSGDGGALLLEGLLALDVVYRFASPSLMTRRIRGTKLWLYCFVLWLGIEYLNLLFSTLGILLVIGCCGSARIRCSIFTQCVSMTRSMLSMLYLEFSMYYG